MNLQLPTRRYFHLDELATRWGVSRRDLLDFALDGHLEMSVMVANLEIEIIDIDQGTWEEGSHLRQCAFGLQPLYRHDLIGIANEGRTTILRFRGPNAGTSMRVLERQSAPFVTQDHLLVGRDEVERFEAVAAGKPQAKTSEPVFSHRNNFTHVLFAGRVYRFGLGQAQVIRQLYDAAQTENPWRSGRELLDGAKSRSGRLQDLFKSKTDPSWKDLILSDGRGGYRLALPPRATWPATKAYRQVMRAFRAGSC